MRPDPQTLAVLRELKARLHRRFGDRLLGVYLFGSRARGTHRPDSDVDVAVVLRGGIERPFAVKRQIIEDTYDLLLERGLYIQPWVLEEGSLEEPNCHRASHLSRAVRREGVAV
jgi:uncharacterized protein